MTSRRTFWAANAAVGALLLIALMELPELGAEGNKLDWWAFKPARKPEVPTVHQTNAVRNEIDRFVLAKLREQKLGSAAPADARTLLRRVTFDLTGLPPPPYEVEAFARDETTNAYEKVVDRLLASPRYGERWARHWLDTVHYGESHGYDKDKPRQNAWPFRDYVIRAFNDDKPYSRFVEEQLAGDVLFPDEPDGMVALGFVAAGPWDFVGHVELPITKTDGLIARYNDRDDMLMNAMSTFQSLTVHCARCHDHKFDPITQRDYYGLQAVFAGVDRVDRPFDTRPEIARRRRELKERLVKLVSERKTNDAEIARLGGDELRDIDRRLGDLKKGAATNTAAFGYHSQISLTPDAIKWVELDLGERRVIDRIVFAGCHDDFNNNGAGFGFPPRFKIELSDDAEFQSGIVVVEDRTRADVPNPGVKPQTISVSGQSARYVRMTATKLAPRKNDYIFALAELMVFDKAGENIARAAKVTALDSIEAPIRWQKKNLVDGYYYGAETNVAVPLLADDLAARRKSLLARVVPAVLRQRTEALDAELLSIRSALAALPKPGMVYAVATEFIANGAFIPASGPRSVHLLKRGDVKKPGEEMKPGAVAAVPGVAADFNLPNPSDEGARRAALAKWITNTNNMLMRRSIVNRVWAYHFGRGIVETPNDFGRMGALPTHPELLDWLAFSFLENGESFKKLHRLIVTSATYRQSSDGEAPAGDPTVDSGNRFLGRMNRPRLDAEQFHDALLAVSGKLDLTMGGASVQQFYFKDDHSPVYDYTRYEVDGAGASRRSIYRFIVRSVPDPFMDALDCPDPNILTPARNVTMTALQALATLNDAFVIRQSEHFAARLAKERDRLDEQFVRAYELALTRAPTDVERARLAGHAAKHGLASACRIIFNSNEFLFVD